MAMLTIDAAGYYEAFLDGAAAASIHGVNNVSAHGYTVAEVGIHFAEHTQGPVQIWVDDIAVGQERINCN